MTNVVIITMKVFMKEVEDGMEESEGREDSTTKTMCYIPKIKTRIRTVQR